MTIAKTHIIPTNKHTILRRPLVVKNKLAPLPTTTTTALTKKFNRRFLLQKRVCFAEKKTVVVIPRKSPEEVTKTWYTNKDYETFGLERKRTILEVQKCNGDVRALSDDMTVAGLEGVFANRSRKNVTRQHRYCVLQRQYSEWYYHGVVDPESLRCVSEYLSRERVARAHLQGVMELAWIN